MYRFLLVLVVACVSIALGYTALQAIEYYRTDEVVEEAPSLDTEMKEMIIFMNPAITEEIANKYLEELRKLNEKYGYVKGGNPKGDAQTMRIYGERVDALQKKYNIIPNGEGAGVQGTGQTKPSLAPKGADPTYVPPAGPPESGAATSSPKLQPQSGKIIGPPAASPTGSASQGGEPESPPLIIQDDIPPPPPLPPMMQS